MQLEVERLDLKPLYVRGTVTKRVEVNSFHLPSLKGGRRPPVVALRATTRRECFWRAVGLAKAARRRF